MYVHTYIYIYVYIYVSEYWEISFIGKEPKMEAKVPFKSPIWPENWTSVAENGVFSIILLEDQAWKHMKTMSRTSNSQYGWMIVSMAISGTEIGGTYYIVRPI